MIEMNNLIQIIALIVVALFIFKGVKSVMEGFKTVGSYEHSQLLDSNFSPQEVLSPAYLKHDARVIPGTEDPTFVFKPAFMTIPLEKMEN